MYHLTNKPYSIFTFRRKLKSTALLRFIVVFLLAICVSACEKEEGEGGTSTIVGRVLVKNYNSDFTIKLGEYYAQGIDVYIVYGSDSIYADDFETGLDGWYRFEFLNKGTYTIFTMSDDPERQSPSGEIPVSQTITIRDNHSTVVVDDLVVYK